MVKNWKHFGKKSDIGELRISKGQYMTGNILGILIEEKSFSNPNGNLVNAKTFDFPVRYKTVREYTGLNDNEVAEDIGNKISELELEGCRAIVTSGGKMGYFSSFIHEKTDLLVLSTPLEMIEFIGVSISDSLYLCIINDLDIKDNIEILHTIGISNEIVKRCLFADTALSEYRYYDGTPFNGSFQLIGSYLWDCIEEPNPLLKERNCPIFSIVNIANLLKDAVMQIPYEGVI